MNREGRHFPSVSVVMTVYEPHPDFFQRAVRSILEQSWRDLELIVVEDPSLRRGEDMLDSAPDRRLRYIANEKRTSFVAQKNLGLQIARGRYIAMMDADDIAHPMRLSKQVEFLDNHPDVGVVGSQIAVIDREGRRIGRRRFPLQHNDILRALPRIVPLSHPSVMIRREVVDSCGGYRSVELHPAEDYEYWSRLIQCGVRFANHPDVLLSYRLHEGQIKFSKLRQTILADLRVKELYWADRMDFRARLWRQGQKLLLRLRERLVARLLMSIFYHAHKPAAGRFRCA